MIKLVSQLREAGSRDVIRAELIDLNTILGEIDELVRSAAGASTEFRLWLAPRLWPVTADPGQVEQILLNLTTNARDAMRDGGSFSIQTQNLTIGHSEAAYLDLPPGAYVCRPPATPAREWNRKSLSTHSSRSSRPSPAPRAAGSAWPASTA